jgi:hypothetical protein
MSPLSAVRASLVMRTSPLPLRSHALGGSLLRRVTPQTPRRRGLLRSTRHVPHWLDNATDASEHLRLASSSTTQSVPRAALPMRTRHHVCNVPNTRHGCAVALPNLTASLPPALRAPTRYALKRLRHISRQQSCCCAALRGTLSACSLGVLCRSRSVAPARASLLSAPASPLDCASVLPALGGLCARMCA